MACAIFYMYQTSGACAGVCACNCTHEMEKAAHCAYLKRIHSDSLEIKSCCVENDIKTVNSGVLSPVSIGLIFVFTQLF